jgi:hypothetical protein
MRVDDDLVVGPDQLEDGVDFADGFGRREWSERQQQQGNSSVHDALPESPKSALPAAVAVTDVSPTRSGADNDNGRLPANERACGRKSATLSRRITIRTANEC